MVTRLASCYDVRQVWFTGTRIAEDVEKHGHKDRIREVQAEYRKKYPHKHRAKLAKRRASKKTSYPCVG